MTNLYPVRLNNKFQQNREQPFPTAPMVPIKVKNSSSFISFFTQVLQLPFMRNTPQVVNTTTSTFFQNTHEHRAIWMDVASPSPYSITWWLLMYSTLKRLTGISRVVPRHPMARYIKERQRMFVGTFKEMSSSSPPTQQPSSGASLSGLRKLQEKVPKIMEPRPVPTKMSPFTYILLPGRNLLHWTMGTIKVMPANNPNRTPQKMIKAMNNMYTLLLNCDIQLEINTQALQPTLQMQRIGSTPNFFDRNRPSLMVSPMEIIMVGNTMAFPSSVIQGSDVTLKQLVTQVLMIPH